MKIQKCSPLYKENLIDNIFSNSALYDSDSFYSIDPQSATYDETSLSSKSLVEKAQIIRSNFLDGTTIIVKNLETFNHSFIDKCKELGASDLHMYLNNKMDSVSFDFHCDDLDVIIHILYGSKRIDILESNSITSKIINAGQEIYIKKGIKHRAINLAASCSLSFGLKENPFYVPGGIESKDLL